MVVGNASTDRTREIDESEAEGVRFVRVGHRQITAIRNGSAYRASGIFKMRSDFSDHHGHLFFLVVTDSEMFEAGVDLDQ